MAGPTDEDRPRLNLDCEDTMDTVTPDSMDQGVMDCEGHTASKDDNEEEDDVLHILAMVLCWQLREEPPVSAQSCPERSHHQEM